MNDSFNFEPRRSESVRHRLDSIDLLRGIVMVLMLLDHTRDFLHVTRTVDPAQLATTTVPLFLTRFVTHFCAPVFLLLSGVGVRLQRERGGTLGDLSRFLVTRGLWLIVLEFTVIRFGFAFSLDYTKFGGMFQIIWVIGIGMIALAGLIHLPVRVVALIGLAITFGSNLLDDVVVPAQPATSLGDIAFMLLHVPGMAQPFGLDGTPFLILYPLFAWLGAMFFGYVLGGLYTADVTSEQRRRTLLWTAAIAFVVFIVLRVPNLYGDPNPWSVQERGTIYTMFSFINVTKYPASLLYLLLLLAPALIFLAYTDGVRVQQLGNTLVQRGLRVLITFGRVPLFFYLLQWFVAHGGGELLMKLPGYEHGMHLPGVYMMWMAGMVVLYYPCRWFAGVKARRREWWVRYL